MATAAHTVTALTAAGLNVVGASELQAITSGAGNGRTFDLGLGPYYIVHNTSGGAINLTIKAGLPSDVSNAGTTIADKTVSIAAGAYHAFKSNKILANTSGTVTLEADGAGLEVLAFR